MGALGHIIGAERQYLKLLFRLACVDYEPVFDIRIFPILEKPLLIVEYFLELWVISLVPKGTILKLLFMMACNHYEPVLTLG